MLFRELELSGAHLIELDPHRDERGYFARCYAEEEFREHSLDTHFPHCNLSHNARRGTLRGMHYAVSPSRESKIVRCVSGAIYDVIADLRPDSASFRRWVAFELSAGNGRAVYVPSGFAHGFLTLVDGTDVFYQMGDFFRAETARGFRWNDEAFGIVWPEAPAIISSRDAAYPDFAPE